MADPYSSPQNFFGAMESQERYPNPYYNIPLQYLPLNMDGMLWWADHFLFRNGFYKSALSRIANYFITSLVIKCEDEDAKKKYEEILKKISWKEQLGIGGLNLLAYGNAYISTNPGFTRYLQCPKCLKVTNINKIDDFQFKQGKYYYSCLNPRCKHTGEHDCVDKSSKDPNQIKVVHWPAREVKVRSEDTTGQAEYYWDIPNSYIQKVTSKNNKFYAKVTPKVIYDCIYDKKMVAFNERNFVHLKMPSPVSLRTDGRSIPPCIYMFEDFFMLQVLKRFNEAICYEDIAPFRVVSMASPSDGVSNPALNMNGGFWKAAVDGMIQEHRKDPGAYHTFPYPLQYQQLGGEGKNLVPVEMMDKWKSDILSALNIPQELYNMNLQTNTVGPALRLFENSWSMLPHYYNLLLAHFADTIGSMLGLPEAEISLIPVTFADDMERKSVVGQLVSTNSIARSELLGLYGFDFKDQIKKKMQEDKDQQELQQEEQEKQQIEQSSEADIFSAQQGGGQPGQGGGGYSTSGSSPQDVQQQAQEIAQQLMPMDGAGRREKLQEIKGQNATLYSSVKATLEQMTSDAKSQGVQQAKQQGQQGQPGAQ